MRLYFDSQLEELNRDMIEMGAMTEKIIESSVALILKKDKEAIEKVVEFSSEVYQKEKEIENLCIKLLLQQQPVAKDLRTISSILKMVTDIERISEQSKDIVEIIKIGNISKNSVTEKIYAMAKEAIHMVNLSIDAFVKKDLDFARSVIAYDDKVDEFFDKIKDSLILEFKKEDVNAEENLDTLMIAKYLERIADHAVNIAYWVIFSITGIMEEEIK